VKSGVFFKCLRGDNQNLAVPEPWSFVVSVAPWPLMPSENATRTWDTTKKPTCRKFALQGEFVRFRQFVPALWESVKNGCQIRL
jgi:hypothetical protein